MKRREIKKTKPGILEQVGCTNGEDPLTNMFVEEIESEETLLEETEPVIEGEEFGYEKRTRLESVLLENVITIKCSFCEELVLKVNIAEHIHSHVVEWGDIVDENGESQYKKNKSKQQSKTPKADPEKNIQDKKTLENTPETNKEDLVKCPFCEKFIPQSSSLEHAKKHVKTGKINNCQHCGKSFRDKGLLKSHERIHTEEKPFGCSFCEKKYKTKESLRVHIQSIHEKIIVGNCDQCGKTFQDKRTFINHQFKHHGKVLGYKCKKCDTQFLTANSLDSHSKDVCFKHVCTFCGKMFKLKCNLNMHSLTHRDPEETKDNVCDKCGKSFNIKSSFDEHKRSHLNQKAFKCNECDKAFNRKSGLWCHKRIHKK